MGSVFEQVAQNILNSFTIESSICRELVNLCIFFTIESDNGASNEAALYFQVYFAVNNWLKLNNKSTIFSWPVIFKSALLVLR